MKGTSCAFNDFRTSLVNFKGVDFGFGSRIAILSHYLDDFVVSSRCQKCPKERKNGAPSSVEYVLLYLCAIRSPNTIAYYGKISICIHVTRNSDEKKIERSRTK